MSNVNTAWFVHLKMVENIPQKFKKVIKCNKLHYFDIVIGIATLLITF